MKECAVNRERAVIANHQMPEVAEPREGALDFPAPAVAPQRSSVLGHRFASIPAMRGDQFDPALSQPLSQRVTVVTTIGDQAERFLSRPPGMGSAAYADRRERRFCELRFVRGCRTKVLSQRKTLAVEHLAVGGPWPSAASSRTWTRKQGPDLLSLGVGQQTTVSRHRPSSGAADLVYLAFPSTQLPQNSGLAPSFETASRHIKYYFTFPVCALERSRWRDGRFACYAPYVMLQGRAFNCDFRFSLIFISQAKSIGCKRKKIQFP